MPSSDTQFKKGQSGNPAGRPKKSKSLSDMLRHILDSDTASLVIANPDGKERTVDLKASENFNYVIAVVMIQKALEGNLRAVQMIWDRMEGKPAQALEIYKPPKPPDPFEGFTTDELRKLSGLENPFPGLIDMEG